MMNLSSFESSAIDIKSLTTTPRGYAEAIEWGPGLVLTGDRAGQLGKIAEVKKGTVSREKMVKLTLPSGEAEVPSRLVFPVGTTAPLITVEASTR